MSAAAIFGGAFNAASSYINYINQRKQNSANRQWENYWNMQSMDFQSREAERSYERQKEMYDYMFQKENDYNSPSKQMQRLRAAGLNPALLAGSAVDAGSSAVSAPASPQASANMGSSALPAAQYDANSIAEMAKAISQIGLNDAQIRKSNKEIEKIGSEIELNKKQQNKLLKETETLQYTLEDILPTQYAKLLAEAEKTVRDMNNSQQITEAQVNLYLEQVKDVIQKVELGKKQNRKLEKELKGYEEYVSDLYRQQKYRSDLTQDEAEYYEITKGLRTRIMNSLSNPNTDYKQLFLDTLMYLMTQRMF